MTSFNVSDFWPSPQPGQTHRFQYSGPVNLRSDFHIGYLSPRSDYFNKAGLLICEDYVDGKWHDQWQLFRHPTRGFIEIGDLEPNTGFEAFVCGPTKQLTYKPFKEIVWGGVQSVGDMIHNPIEVDRSSSTGLGIVVDNAGNYGWQTVIFEDLHNDILQMSYAQWWGNSKSPTGARYWMTRGVGPTAIAWLKPDGSFTDTIIAQVKVIG
jgi:hypothetical protein